MLLARIDAVQLQRLGQDGQLGPPRDLGLPLQLPFGDFLEGRLVELAADPPRLDHLDVDELPFPPDTAVRLARLRASTGLKMLDCCVLLAAEDAAAAIASFDERLVQTADARNVPVFGR